MKITDQLLDKIEKLSMLSFNDSEREQYKEEFQRILNFVEKLQEVDTSQVEPLIHVTNEVNHLREDEITGQVSREEALKNAPDSDGRFFVVPKVVKD